VKKVTITNARGDSVEISRTPFFLTKIEGIGDVEANIQTQKAPYQDGSTFIDSTLSERVITIEADILKDFQTNRQLLSKVLNPKNEIELKYEDKGITRYIKGVPEHVPIFPDTRGTPTRKAMIGILCPNPYWLTEEKVDQLVVWKGGLEFPLELPTFFAQQSNNKAKILFNDGDVETPIFLTFHGPATAPIKIINVTTGEFIEVNQSLLVGERLEINTAFGQKKVTKVLADGTEVNAFHYISLDSTFFQLIPGNNLLDYSTGADYERAAVKITWRNRYLSV